MTCGVVALGSGLIGRRVPPGSGALGGDAARHRDHGLAIWIGWPGCFRRALANAEGRRIRLL